MKKIYTNPMMETVVLTDKDVLRTSVDMENDPYAPVNSDI